MQSTSAPLNAQTRITRAPAARGAFKSSLARAVAVAALLMLSAQGYAQETPAKPSQSKDSPRPQDLEPAVNTSAPPPSALEPAVDTSTPPPQSVLEPAVDTSAPADAPAPAQNQKARTTSRSGKAMDRLELDTTQITGNRELPKVLYIVPWKRSDLGDLLGKPVNSLLDEVLTPVDRDVHKRENRYYSALESGTQPDAAQGATAK